jgi:hypothetical protein
MSSINKILNQLKSTSSRLEKEAILQKNSKNALLMRVIHLALDPQTQFYQRKIPKYTTVKSSSRVELADILDGLDSLSSRKVTGNAAIDFLAKLLGSLSNDDAAVLERIIQKDLDCGVHTSTANKIWPNLVSDYPCMLTAAYDDKLVAKMQFPAIAQLKMDGMRFNAIVDVKEKTVKYYSRNGKFLDVNYDAFDAAFQQMAKNIGMSQVVFDGELVVADSEGNLLDRKTGNGILNKATKGTISDKERLQVRATVWDLIPNLYFFSGKCDVDYESRLSTVVVAVDNLDKKYQGLVTVAETNIVENLDAAQKLFEFYHSAGQEGIILKSRSGNWENKRVKHQIKFKGELDCDLLCVDWEEGTGKNRGKLGALVLESSDGVVKVSVGTGLSDELRAKLKRKDVIGKVVAVKYNSRITNKLGDESLFLPVFVEIREDKTKADSSKKIK